MRLVPLVAIIALAACHVAGCSTVGPWTPRADGATCRKISGPLGIGRGYLECFGGVMRTR